MIGNFKKSVLHQKWHNRDNTAGALEAMGKAVLTVSVKFRSKGIPSANTGGYYAPTALVVGRRGPRGGSRVRSWVALPPQWSTVSGARGMLLCAFIRKCFTRDFDTYSCT